jgi:hypothetical protein
MGATEQQDALLSAIVAMPRDWYAVADGALFDDLPALLRSRRLESHPLYLEAADGAGVRAGPHLVPLAGPLEVRALLGLLEGKPAAVFWSWPGDLASLRRHLRGLNLAEIPNERAGEPGEPAYETVLFRHWDPNVLAVTLPVLSADQFSRFLSEANGISLDAGEHHGLARLARPDGLPPKPKGNLRFSADQISATTERRIAASHQRITAYLREVAPAHTAAMDQAALAAAVVRFDQEANDFGLNSERDVARWAYLNVLTGGRLRAIEGIRAAFLVPDAGPSPSVCLDRLLLAVEMDLRGRD